MAPKFLTHVISVVAGVIISQLLSTHWPGILDAIQNGSTSSSAALQQRYDELLQNVQEMQKRLDRGEHRQSSKSGVVHDDPLYYTAVSNERIKKMNLDHLLYDSNEYEFAIVSDLDIHTRHPEKFLWHAVFKRGLLDRDDDGYKIVWTHEDKLFTKTAMKNRSMELSELVQYKHMLLGFCDITGLVFKITVKDGKSKVLQRYAIADGDGNSAKPFKAEWATVKDGRLWVGSAGKEWTTLPPDPPGIVHTDPQWVKVIDENGFISNVDWHVVYEALRTKTNTTYPGYLWHEAVFWDARIRKWLFLPRKASEKGPYDPITDISLGSNFLFVCSETFSEIEVMRIGPLEPMFGFSSLKRIPGTTDYLALKTFETEDETNSKIVAFNLEGKYQVIAELNGTKYEGLEFLR
eukprot:m.23771 g.23771  ORF g.23771 m.23771 type:complete len:406 (+) comp14349_c0_seq1:175-1392(+)